MQIRVRYFDHLRDAFGTHEAIIEMPEDATLIELCYRMLPGGGPGRLPRVSYVLNWRDTDMQARLHPGDEVALLPFA